MTPSEALQAIRAVVQAQYHLESATEPDEAYSADDAFYSLAGSTDWSAVLEALEGK